MSTTIGPAISEPGELGKAPVLTLLLDTNGDGTPDYKEPKVMIAIAGAVASAAIPFCPAYTVFGQLLRAVLTVVIPALTR